MAGRDILAPIGSCPFSCLGSITTLLDSLLSKLNYHSSFPFLFAFILWTTVTLLSLKYFLDYRIFLLTYLAGSSVPTIFAQGGGFSQPEPKTHAWKPCSVQTIPVTAFPCLCVQAPGMSFSLPSSICSHTFSSLIIHSAHKL